MAYIKIHLGRGEKYTTEVYASAVTEQMSMWVLAQALSICRKKSLHTGFVWKPWVYIHREFCRTSKIICNLYKKKIPDQ